MTVGCLIIFMDFSRAPQEISGSIDFPAFYNSGRLLNEYPGSRLYDPALQHRLYLDLAPASSEDRFFAYTPFFAVFFSPLARLPHSLAFVCWILISLCLFTGGFWFAWAGSGLPSKYRTQCFLIALSFVPFYAWCVLAGQVSAFGFFWLALAIYLDTKSRFASGCALALLLYKPPLLILLIPMLVVTKRWPTLLGFGVVGTFLLIISLIVIGPIGVPAYLEMLRTFSAAKAAGRLTSLDVDIYSFLAHLFGPSIATWLAASLGFALFPFLFLGWRKRPESAWGLAITWTLVLNFYMLIYDTTLIVLSVLILLSTFCLLKLPCSLRWLLVALFLVPWPAVAVSRSFGVQIMTVVLIVFGTYQLVNVQSSAPHEVFD
jgi:hypothetical protein